VIGAGHLAVSVAREDPGNAAPGATPAEAPRPFSPARRRLRVLKLLHRSASTARRRTESTRVVLILLPQWRISTKLAFSSKFLNELQFSIYLDPPLCPTLEPLSRAQQANIIFNEF